MAIKRIQGVFDDDSECKQFIREVRLLKRISHPCVTKFVEVIVPNDDYKFFDEIYIVLECAQSDLGKLI